MNTRLQTIARPPPARSFTPVRHRFLQRSEGSCGCREEDEREERRIGGGILQRRAAGLAEPSTIPPIVDEVLRSPGQPLDPATRAFMEPRFGHDFGRVRVHADAKAAQSARAVNALAYTVGRDVVFGAAHYAPGTPAGRRLVAHELTHVVQQGDLPDLARRTLRLGRPHDVSEREAGRMADGPEVEGLGLADHLTPVRPSVQRVCGSRKIGKPGGCTPVGDVSVFDIATNSDELFLFKVNCDDFRAGEEDRLRSVAAGFGPGDVIEIHGFASEEGDPEFNEHLSCARALKAKSVVTRAASLPPSIRAVFKHGATAGPRSEHRSVVIPSPTPARTPAPPRAKTVIVIGSPSPGQAYGLQFVNAALCHGNDADTIWLVEHSGYEMIYGTSPRVISDQAPAGGYGWITPTANLVGWLNSRPDSSIGRLVVYSHGVPGLVALRYGWSSVGMPDYGLNLTDVARLRPSKFTPAATIEFNSCNTGTDTNGNLAQAFADQARRPVEAWTGRTSYARINRGTCRVTASTYSLSTDAITEFWNRLRAGTAPRLRTFTPQRGTTP